MASDKKKVLSKKHIDPSDAIKKHLMEQPSKKKPEYLVRGALLHCRCGSYARRLNLSKDHAIYMTEHPVIHELNCICGEGENITPFGVCRSTRPAETEIITCAKDVPRGPNGEPTGPAPSGVDIGRKCSPVIVDLKWTNTYQKTRIVDNGEHNPGDRALAKSIMGAAIGEATVTTLSFLVCKYGGLIEPYTSGQEYDDANLTQEEFLKNIQEQFGFDYETAQIMWDVYTQLQAKYPNATQGEIDWRFARLLGGFVYDDGFLEEIAWPAIAGQANDQYKIVQKKSVPLTEEEYFVDFLDIPQEDYLLLRYKVRIQNGVSGSRSAYYLPDDYCPTTEEDKKQFTGWKNFCENATGQHFNSDEEFLRYWIRQFNQFDGKSDFAHQQITTATILATPLQKENLLVGLVNDELREDLAGWLGDAVLDDGDGISFGPDDYMADLDAENITSLMSKEGLPYLEAFNTYYEKINAGESRADIFLKDTGLDTVKQKIYSILVYPNLIAEIDIAMLTKNIPQLIKLSNLYTDDDYLLDRVKMKSEDTYNFIRSLEDGAHEMETDS